MTSSPTLPPDTHVALFRQGLLAWAETVRRPLPWKGTQDPYRIWLSEILLQQTRAMQGLPYYLRFVERFPNVQTLANADEDEVMKLWEGLGYYARARNLMKTAQIVAFEKQGQFPDSYEGLLQLPGVGAYTAAAIASFAYNAPYAVLDGNVFRVLSRFFGLAQPIDTPQGRRVFEQLAHQALDTAQPARYNQAIMDFGALCCTPKSPQCSNCPLRPHCRAFSEQIQGQLPVKSRSLVKRERYFHYLVMEYEGRVYIRKRTDKDIWANLYDFPLIEMPALAGGLSDVQQHPLWQEWLGMVSHEVRAISMPLRQMLTHQRIVAVFVEIALQKEIALLAPAYTLVERQSLTNFAFPKLIGEYLGARTLGLNLI